ncbi:MAG TPA: glycosyltransferase family 2 protein [Chloroflexia bacterium]|nr:glycosyltransferase family 2 protein [Chloroflexia bacterium]
MQQSAPEGVDISAIIVNYNGGRYLAECLQALRAASGGLSVETIIVDNGSTDESVNTLAQAEHAGTTVIQAGRNLGFGRANNLGAAQASGRDYLLLNTDCFLRAGSLEALIAALEGTPGCGIVGPRLLNSDGTLQPSCHNFPSPLVLFIEQSLLWKLLRRLPLINELLFIASGHKSKKPVDWLAGACLLVRSELYKALGGFDERFFFYWEEADLCLQVKEQGWTVLFEPGAEAVHLGGGSTTNPNLLVQFFRSLYLFYRKHYSRRQLLAARAVTRVMALFKAARLLRPKADENRHASLSEAAAWVRVFRL